MADVRYQQFAMSTISGSANLSKHFRLSNKSFWPTIKIRHNLTSVSIRLHRKRLVANYMIVNPSFTLSFDLSGYDQFKQCIQYLDQLIDISNIERWHNFAKYVKSHWTRTVSFHRAK